MTLVTVALLKSASVTRTTLSRAKASTSRPPSDVVAHMAVRASMDDVDGDVRRGISRGLGNARGSSREIGRKACRPSCFALRQRPGLNYDATRRPRRRLVRYSIAVAHRRWSDVVKSNASDLHFAHDGRARSCRLGAHVVRMRWQAAELHESSSTSVELEGHVEVYDAAPEQPYRLLVDDFALDFGRLTQPRQGNWRAATTVLTTLPEDHRRCTNIHAPQDRNRSDPRGRAQGRLRAEGRIRRAAREPAGQGLPLGTGERRPANVTGGITEA